MFGLVLFLLDIPAASLVALLDYLGNLDVDFVRRLLQFEILAELLVNCRKELVRHFRVGIDLHLDTLPAEEIHEDVESDIVLSDYLA